MSKQYVVNKVKEELAGYQKIRAALTEQYGDDLDSQTLLDTLEGETDLHEALCAVGEEIQENAAQIAGLDSYINDLQSRKARIKATNETLRNIITMAMDRASIKTIRAVPFTLSTRPVKPGLEVIDEALIPAGYWKPQDPKLDRGAVQTALEEGVDIPGAKLGNGGISLTIRVK